MVDDFKSRGGSPWGSPPGGGDNGSGRGPTPPDIDEIIRNTSEPAYHPSCSNKMGNDQNSVVDQKTKVHGVQNLRVIDASIMPDIVSANLNATVVMIAERASDFILD